MLRRVQHPTLNTQYSWYFLLLKTRPFTSNPQKRCPGNIPDWYKYDVDKHGLAMHLPILIRSCNPKSVSMKTTVAINVLMILLFYAIIWLVV